MRALSLTPPWPFAILRCGKTIENRQGWDCGAYAACRAHRGTIALHASGLPGGVGTWWKRARLEQSYAPRASQQEAIEEFESVVDGCMAAAQASGIAVERPGLRELCAMTGHIVGTAKVIGSVYPIGDKGRVEINYGGVNSFRLLSEEERRWWMGGFALVLDDVAELPKPVPCKGALGLWPVPTPVLEQMGVAA